jgi:hypothetical protein
MEITAKVNLTNILDKIGRYFNSDPSTILDELLQNSRRAGATEIHIRTNGNSTTITDNGCGIEDPQVLVDLFNSDWEGLPESEDPAGAGLFSLASHGCIVRSKYWSVELTKDVFAGKAAAEVKHEGEYIAGTSITVPIRILQPLHIQRLRYFPAAIFVYDGDSPDYTTTGGCDYIEERLDYSIRLNRRLGTPKVIEYQGLKIGFVIKNFKETFSNSLYINFYGIQVNEVDGSLPFDVYIDVIGDTPLRFVLPDRKQVYKNDFYYELVKYIKTIIYQTIMEQESHTLPYRFYEEAKELLPEFPESTPIFIDVLKKQEVTVGQNGNLEGIYKFQQLRYKDYFSCLCDPLAKACSDNNILLVYVPDTHLGYSWASIEEVTLSVVIVSQQPLPLEVEQADDGSTYGTVHGGELKSFEQFADSIKMLLTRTSGNVYTAALDYLMVKLEEAEFEVDTLGDGQETKGSDKKGLVPNTISADYKTTTLTDLDIFSPITYSWFDPACLLDSASILYLKNKPELVNDVVDYLVNSVFDVSDVSNSEAENCERDFRRDATDFVLSLLHDEDSAIKEYFIDVLNEHRYRVPNSTSVAITLTNNRRTDEERLSITTIVEVTHNQETPDNQE